METIKFTVAMPTEGEDVENLNAQKFADAIASQLREEFEGEYRVEVEVIDNDGTAEDSIELPTDDDDLNTRALDAMTEAVSDAYNDPVNYKPLARLATMEIGDTETHWGDNTTYVVRTSAGWSVCDNGEEVNCKNADDAARIVTENVAANNT